MPAAAASSGAQRAGSDRATASPSPRMAHVGLTRPRTPACPVTRTSTSARSARLRALSRRRAREVRGHRVLARAARSSRSPASTRRWRVRAVTRWKRRRSRPARRRRADSTGIGTECVSCHQDPHAGQFTRVPELPHRRHVQHRRSYTHLRARALTCVLRRPARDAPAARATSRSSRRRWRSPRAGASPVVNYRVSTTCTSLPHRRAPRRARAALRDVPQAMTAGRTTSSRVRRRAAVAVALLARPPPAAAQFETPNRQFHNQTTFPLDGRHRDLPCESCHRKRRLQGHADAVLRLSLGPPAGRSLPAAARLAVRAVPSHHVVDGRALGPRRDDGHAARRRPPAARVPVVPREQQLHERAQAAACSCHQKDYQAAKTPNHAAAGFPTACEACHRPSDATFTQARFDHAAVVPAGRRARAQARARPAIATTSIRARRATASAVTATDYDRTTTPEPRGRRLPDDAARAATAPTRSRACGGAGFNHNAVFPLVGAHASRSCATCHVNNVYRGTPRDCVGCHRTDYDRTTTPNHAAAGFPTTCETCHRADRRAASRGAGFNHAAVFALVGVHAQQVVCDLPREQRLSGARRATASAVTATDYDRTTTPNHAAAGFPTTCESCHRADRRELARAPASITPPCSRSSGGTPATSCATCHVNNVYQGHAARLRRLPPDRLRPHDGPEPRGRRLPDDVRELSPGHRRELPRRVASTTAASSRSSAGTRSRPARPAT